jgi:hypothetical protein
MYLMIVKSLRAKEPMVSFENFLPFENDPSPLTHDVCQSQHFSTMGFGPGFGPGLGYHHGISILAHSVQTALCIPLPCMALWLVRGVCCKHLVGTRKRISTKEQLQERHLLSFFASPPPQISSSSARWLSVPFESSKSTTTICHSSAAC